VPGSASVLGSAAPQPAAVGFERSTRSAFTVTPPSALVPRTEAHYLTVIAARVTSRSAKTSVFAETVTVVEPVLA
jgi:hypothetical protein